MKKIKIKWLKAPQKHDYPAARAYLQLILQPREAKKVVGQIEGLKDRGICREGHSSCRQCTSVAVGQDVKSDLQLINDKKALSPVLLYRDPALRKLIVVDGYHRLCAVYSFDEQAMIPCHIV